MIRQIFFITLICLLSAQCQSEDIAKSKSKISVDDIEKLFKGLGSVQSAFTFAQFVYRKVRNIPSESEQTAEYLHKLSADLQRVLTLDVQILENTKEILKLMGSEVERNLLAEKVDKVTTLVSKMRRNFDTYLDYKNEVLKNNGTGVRQQVTPAVKSYVDNILDRHTSEVIQTLGSIQDQIAVKNGNEYNAGVLPLMLRHLQDFTNLCNTNKSMNMILYDTFELIRNTEVIADAIVLFAYEVLEMSSKGSSDSRKTLINNELIRTENKINAAFKYALQKSSRAVWTCSPINKFKANEQWASLNDAVKGDGRIYINLEPVKSDIEKSMVVTGARFARKLFIDVDKKYAVELCIEIQQGKLLDDGTIDAATLQWKDSSSVAKPRRTSFVLGNTEFALWAQDFHNILDGTNPIVLTGLALKEHLTGRFGLQAYGSPVVTPTIGSIKIVNKFIEADSFVIPEKPENGRFTHVKKAIDMHVQHALPIQNIFDTQSSNLATGRMNIIKRYNAYVKFDHSKNKADKMVVPFIDLVNAVTNPPVPLSGVGAYYKTTEGFSGSIGIELLTLSFEKRIPDEVKPSA